MKPPRAVVLLGAQRFTRTLSTSLRALEVTGRVAIITAGWQEREAEDEELREHLELDSMNLRLHRRCEQLFAEDPELREAHRKKQELLRFKQDFYRIRLEHALDADHVIRQRAAPDQVHDEAEGASIASIRALDTYHLEQCARLRDEFDKTMVPRERPAVRRQRDELRKLLADARSVAIAGGHVATLVNRLRLFGLLDLLDGHVVFAWSAGAMALCDRIVLFHDNTPQGSRPSEVLDRGIGIVPNLVVFPEPETRLRLDDAERVAVLSQRFAPASALGFPAGAHVTWRDGRLQAPSEVISLNQDGTTAMLHEEAS